MSNLKMLCFFIFFGILLVKHFLMYLFINTTHYFLTFIENYKIDTRYENNLIFKKSMVSILFCMFSVYYIDCTNYFSFLLKIFPKYSRLLAKASNCCKYKNYSSWIVLMLAILVLTLPTWYMTYHIFFSLASTNL